MKQRGTCVCREQREAAARTEAQGEREAVLEPGSVTKMGAKFWAQESQADKDIFGQPRSTVGNEIFQQEDIIENPPSNNDGAINDGDEGVVNGDCDDSDDVPPLIEALTISGKEMRDEATSTQNEIAVDSENVFLEID